MTETLQRVQWPALALDLLTDARPEVHQMVEAHIQHCPDHLVKPVGFAVTVACSDERRFRDLLAGRYTGRSPRELDALGRWVVETAPRAVSLADAPARDACDPPARRRKPPAVVVSRLILDPEPELVEILGPYLPLAADLAWHMGGLVISLADLPIQLLCGSYERRLHLISVGRSDDQARMRSTAAHELAHALLQMVPGRDSENRTAMLTKLMEAAEPKPDTVAEADPLVERAVALVDVTEWTAPDGVDLPDPTDLASMYAWLALFATP